MLRAAANTTVVSDSLPAFTLRCAAPSERAATDVAFLGDMAQGEAKRLASGPLGERGGRLNSIEITLAIRVGLQRRTLPRGPSSRIVGEYGGRALCAGCGERITSAQASYTVDFAPGVTPESVRFHRQCFEIWQAECTVVPPP
jgi:hypothetical protein